MPRVTVARKNRAGHERSCGRCQQPIEPGQQYRQWSFRYGGTHYRCMRPGCAPRRSELTQSKMGTVYSAVEAAEDELDNGKLDTEAIEALVTEQVAEAVREVAEEYREADEAFGGMGATESSERADELEGWADDLESFAAEEHASTCDECDGLGEVPDEDDTEGDAMLTCDTCGGDGEVLAAQDVGDAAREVLGGCPL